MAFTGLEVTAAEFKHLLDATAKKFKAASKNPKPPIVYQHTRSAGRPSLIIFLDIDGVCWVDPRLGTNRKFYELLTNMEVKAVIDQYKRMLIEQYDMREEDYFSNLIRIACFDPEHMLRISQLCEEFNAKIVVSSNWRHGRKVTHLQNILDLWDLGQYVIGKTPEVTSSGPDPLCHDYQIEKWLQDNGHLTDGFVILDDLYEDAMTSKFPKQFVHCQTTVGFDDACYQKARKLIMEQKEAIKTLEETRQAFAEAIKVVEQARRQRSFKQTPHPLLSAAGAKVTSGPSPAAKRSTLSRKR